MDRYGQDMLAEDPSNTLEPKSLDGPVRQPLRFMTHADLNQIEGLFFNVFRRGRGSRSGFADYFRRLFLDGPHAGGALISENETGGVAAAIAFVPIRYKIYNETVLAKLSCAFMADTRFPKAAARIVLSLRARSQDLLLTDSVSHEGMQHWLAGGGAALGVQSLGWTCQLKPLTATAQRFRFPRLLDGVTEQMDRFLAFLRPRPSMPATLTIEAVRLEDFAALVPEMLARFPVRPDWTHEELCRLLGLATENAPLGRLRFFRLVDCKGKVLGCFAGYFDRRKRVRVLDLLALDGAEVEVVASVLAHLRALGQVEASGVTQPHLLLALSPQRGMSFRHRSFTCVASRFESVTQAVRRNEIYVGGLAGEGWSRLMTDFY